MRSFLRILVALAAFLPLAVLATDQPHFEVRVKVVLGQQQLLGTGDVVVFGDSNTEQFWWNINGGCQVLNAGFGGATARELIPYAEQIAASALPKIVHIMVGTNNIEPALLANWYGQEQFNAFHDDLTSLVVSFKSRGAKIVLWPIPPFASGYADLAKRDQLNAVIQTVATEQGVLWDWWWPQQITVFGAASGYAAVGAVQGDGVHLSASSQVSRYYRMETWRTYIQQTTGVNCAN